MKAETGTSNSVIEEITRNLGRPLRVLHIGNIANNAYNNAKIQRQYGIEADVLSYDYYHVMGVPEWEDAQFEGEIDPNMPNWWGTSLKGWNRPEWFVQGPVSSCLQYLRVKRFGNSQLQKLLWRYLEARCLGVVRYAAAASGKTVEPMPLRLGFALKQAQWLGLASGPDYRVSFQAIARILALKTRNGLPLFPVDERNTNHASLFPPAIVPAKLLPQTPKQDRQHLPGQVRNPKRGGRGLHALVMLVKEVKKGARSSAKWFLRRTAVTAYLLCKELKGFIRWLLSAYLKLKMAPEIAKLKSGNKTVSTQERDQYFISLIENNFDDIEKAQPEDRVAFLIYCVSHCAQFIDIFENYDVVQCYSIDGCLCVVNGFTRFLSYEHGTLRDLPFGNDFYGIVTRIAYRASTYVFVTNSDVLPSASRMGLDPSRVICLPHAFDDRKLMRFRQENAQLQPPADGPPIIFSPTRQHWLDKSGSWTKGNDILFRAAAQVAAEGLDFRLHLVAWGKEIDESKALLAELGISNRVVWLPTMQKRELWAAYCTANAVADQFILPALGGVGFEAMSLGCRLITAIDEAQLTDFFGAAPPCLSASTVEACAMQLRRIIEDPYDEAGLGRAAHDWMREYHSAARIVDIQANTYLRFLQGAG